MPHLLDIFRRLRAALKGWSPEGVLGNVAPRCLGERLDLLNLKSEAAHMQAAAVATEVMGEERLGRKTACAERPALNQDNGLEAGHSLRSNQ